MFQEDVYEVKTLLNSELFKWKYIPTILFSYEDECYRLLDLEYVLNY
jgi:hypothetical protein